MMLIQQLCSSHQASADRFYRTLYESLLDARLIASSKQSMYLNLLYRSLKADGSVKRVKAFVKRILQMLAVHQPSFICGCFFLLQELNRTFPSLSALIDQPEEHGLDEEIYEDVREPEDGIPMRKEPQTLPLTNNAYDSRKRDPEYSNADNSCLWELIPFLAHFHPSVSVSAEHILGGINLPGKPDLELHTLIHFLDRFAYRTAKIGSSRLRGSSIMQPLVGGDTADLLVSSTLGGQLPVNSEKFWARRSEDVPPEDAFFHQYFNNIGKMTHASKKSKKMRKDGDEEGSEEEESEIWKAMMESAPELEGVDDSDDDLQMSDLDSQFEASSNESPDEDGRHEIESAASSDKGLDSDLDMALARESSESASDHDYPLKTKSPGDGRKTSKSHRKWKHLPTFAAADSYAKMIDDEDGEDLG